MTLKQFRYLSETDQEFVLTTKAVNIASILTDSEQLELFQIDGFYLEVQFFGATLKVKTINYFEETELLEPYLTSININELTQLL